MPSLSVRRIDDEIYERLRIRAARHGVSMEEEVRQILKRVVSAPERLGDLARHCFEGKGMDLDLPARDHHEPISLDE